jgi:hypothetical protein
MESWDVLVKAREVPEPDDAVVNASVMALLAQTRNELAHHETAKARRPHRSKTLLVGSAAALVVTCIVLASLLITGRTSNDRHSVSSPAARPTFVSLSAIRLISASTAAVADSGTAVESTTTSGGIVAIPPTTLDVTFSGQDVNYLVASSGDGAEGVQNRVVNGQLYLYIKGPDLEMHWYHDTTPGSGTSLGFPDPRTLISAVGPALRFEDVGQKHLGGILVTHLRATTPGGLSRHAIHGLNGTITSFDAWVDANNVVRQISVTSTYQTCSLGNPGNAPIAHHTVPSTANENSGGISASPKLEPETSTPSHCATATSQVQLSFTDLGTPETVTVAPGAIDKASVG